MRRGEPLLRRLHARRFVLSALAWVPSFSRTRAHLGREAPVLAHQCGVTIRGIAVTRAEGARPRAEARAPGPPERTRKSSGQCRRAARHPRIERNGLRVRSGPRADGTA